MLGASQAVTAAEIIYTTAYVYIKKALSIHETLGLQIPNGCDLTDIFPLKEAK